MNARIFVAALLVCAVACKPGQEDDLNPQQVEQVKHEATAAVDTIIARFTRLDIEGALAVYHDSPDFMLLGADGVKLDYATNKKAAMDLGASASSIAITTKADDCQVMSADLAICAWTGKEVVVLKTGDTVTYDPFGVTLVFKKFEKDWKVTYSHESGTGTTQKASKKWRCGVE